MRAIPASTLAGTSDAWDACSKYDKRRELLYCPWEGVRSPRVKRQELISVVVPGDGTIGEGVGIVGVTVNEFPPIGRPNNKLPNAMIQISKMTPIGMYIFIIFS